ncbi:hypothetical protein JCM10207_000365 [Rhodosporidiobolus poonsookiae]
MRNLINLVTPIAPLLGAVNTVSPSSVSTARSSSWATTRTGLALFASSRTASCLSSTLAPSELVGPVIGAGGAGRAAVHALHEAGMTTIYLYNRTRKTAEDLVFSLPSIYNIILIDNLSAASFEEGLPDAIVGTLPAKATRIEADERGADQVLLPEDGLLREGGVVVCDMAYLPRLEQFRLWNNLELPVELCRQKVVKEYKHENPL